MIYDLGKTSSLVSHYLAELRDVELQTDRARFRRNMDRLGGIFAYEISKCLPSTARHVKTPLGTAVHQVPQEHPVLVAILRAGLPLHQGLLSFFDRADCGYVGAYRNHTAINEFEIRLDYLSCSSIEGRTVVVADPMLATGKSIVTTLDQLLRRGKPSELHVVSVISAKQGVDYLSQHYPWATIWTAGIDPLLNDRSYIVPGLGDAGDLAFGSPASEADKH